MVGLLFKIAIIVLVAYVVYVKLFKRQPVRDDSRNTHHKRIEDTMVACVKCGTFVSMDEAIIKDGNYYCSKECAEVK